MKDRAKAFMFICIGLMALAVGLQTISNPVQAQGTDVVSITAEGNRKLTPFAHTH